MRFSLNLETEEVVDSVISSCEQYRKGLISLEILQRKIWDAAQLITSIEDMFIRQKLETFEGRLEIIRHTVDDSAVYGKACSAMSAIAGIKGDEPNKRVSDGPNGSQ